MAAKRSSKGRTATAMTGAQALLLTLALAACTREPPGAGLPEGVRGVVLSQIVETPPSGMIQSDARFGGLELLGYLLKPRTVSVAPKSDMTVTFVWRVNDALAEGFLPFTHLTDARGRMLKNLDAAGPLRALAQVSGPPLPPWRWPEDRIVLDPVSFRVPEEAPAQIELRTGFFRDRTRHSVRGKAIDAVYRAAWVKLRVEGREGAEPHSFVPRLTVGQRDGAITIDGVLDEPAWAEAAATGAFVHAGDGRAASGLPLQGRARLTWDDAHFYAAFEVSDRDLRGGFAEDAVDPHLWTRDTIELMIDRDGDNRDYYEIQVSPQGLVFDSRFDAYNRPRGGPEGPFGHQSWSSQLERAVTVLGTLDDDSDEDEGYVVELRIPWSAFGALGAEPPQPGESWRMNFYAMQDNGGLAWSPILGQGNFHRASRFGRVRFTR